MTMVRERFNPIPMGVDSSYVVSGPHIGGFLAKTSGAITIVTKDSLGTSDVTIVNAVPLTAGIYTPIPIIFPAIGGTITLSGGASGTLMV